MRALARALLISWLAGLVTSCGYELDTTRHPQPRGTLGQEVFRILHQDLSRRAPEKAAALAREEARFSGGIDGLIPDSLRSCLQDYLVQTLPLYDESRIPAFARTGACLLAELGADFDLLSALWHARHVQGYGDGRVLMPLLRRALQYPRIHPLLQALSDRFLSHDGLDATFTPSNEDDTYRFLHRELCRRLRSASASEPAPNAADRTLVDFFLTEDARLLPAGADRELLVRIDHRGRARVLADPQTGALPAPFVDADGDGLADVHPVSGDFVDAAGQPLSVPPPLDGAGEPTRVDGRTLYRIVDLPQSVLAALQDQLPALVADERLWDLVAARRVLLGLPSPRADADGLYSGYDPLHAPALEIFHALRALGAYPRLPEFLDAVQTLAELAEPELARLLDEIDRAGAVLGRYPELSLRPHHRLLDDLLERVRECAERGYLRITLQRLSDPRLKNLTKGFADLIRYRDRLSDASLVFDEPTDFSAPDGEYPNRSNLQRLLHLIYDTRGTPYRAYIDLFGWFEIDDLLDFYLDSFGGQASVPSWISPFISEFGSSHPTPEDVNRFIAHDHSVLGNPQGNEGRDLKDYNGESLLGFELSGALEALQPLFSEWVVRDRGTTRSGTALLADLLASLHPHFSCRLPHASPACADVAPLQPMLLEILDATGLVDALLSLLSVAADLTTPAGLSVVAEIDGFARFALAPDASLTTLDGAASVLAGDGVTPVAPISPFYLLLHGLRALDDARESDPAGDAAIERLSERLGDVFLGVEKVGSLYRFSNRRTWIVVLNALHFVTERAESLRAKGTWASKLAELESDLVEAVGGRVLPAALAALVDISSDAGLRADLVDLLLYLLAPADPAARQEARRLFAWLLQTLESERLTLSLSHALGRVLSPDRLEPEFVPGAGCQPGAAPLSWVSRLFDLLLRLSRIDPGGCGAFASLLANAAADTPGAAGFVIDDLLSVLEAVQRQDPAQTGELSAGDYARTLSETADFLLDGEKGLEKFYQMIDRRDGF
ncbi:MAG: hypothetical protein GYA21_18385 [Myxococcales bacterium]|nr:hypothetical protein [Myxococcales bacterium]